MIAEAGRAGRVAMELACGNSQADVVDDRGVICRISIGTNVLRNGYVLSRMSLSG